MTYFTLPTNNVARKWLMNGVFALSMAGIYSILLVVLRTPVLAHFINNKNLFKTHLIVHVNLSVLVWFLSISGIFWSNNLKNLFLGKICVNCAFLATTMIAISPFFPTEFAISNNYIPMLDNIVFVLGLSLFLASVLVFTLNIVYESLEANLSFLNLTSLLGALIFISSCVCFLYSYLSVVKVASVIAIDLELFYELLYWSGGHILQFLFTHIMIIAWCFILPISSNSYKYINYLLMLNSVIAIIGAITGHVLYDIEQPEFKLFFTNHMRYFGGVAVVLASLILYRDIIYNKTIVPALPKNIFFCSNLMFIFGGVIGLMINGTNVTIPAHYHGSIVAITIALMGLAYLYCEHQRKKFDLFSLQIILSAVGQILHISGLALAGGYGVLRKTPYSELAIKAKLAMIAMGIGGIIAILSGLMFILFFVRYYNHSKVSCKTIASE